MVISHWSFRGPNRGGLCAFFTGKPARMFSGKTPRLSTLGLRFGGKLSPRFSRNPLKSCRRVARHIAEKSGIHLMRRFAIFCFVVWFAPSAFAQMTFNDLPSYCKAASEASTPTLLARTQNIPRSHAEALMQGMTDPATIRMVKEVITFAYSRPQARPLKL